MLVLKNSSICCCHCLDLVLTKKQDIRPVHYICIYGGKCKIRQDKKKGTHLRQGKKIETRGTRDSIEE